MASNTFVYKRGAELPGLTLPWQEQLTASTWGDLDLTTGYTFTVSLKDSAGTVTTPSTTPTGFNGGVTIAWATGALDITAGLYQLHVRARETATSKDRDYSPADPPLIRIVD